MATLRCLALAVTAVAVVSLAGRSQDAPPDPESEVLTRGPVHEAYASAVSVQPAPGPIAPKAPPAPIEELPPDEKPDGDNVQWIPGYWSWDDERSDFIWVSGFWRIPPPGRQWVPGVWHETNGQWQYTPGFWTEVEQSLVDYLPAPPPPVDSGPPTPAPGPDHLYAPGCWVYQQTRYVWRPGFWYAYRPNWIYVPAHYVWTPYGYVFVNGYWDYPLRQRGLLFAPVCFRPGIYARPAFVYRPRYVVYDDFLYGALFVRPGCGYYFGDYFDLRYTNAGYRSWFSVSIGSGGYDPLFNYYRASNGSGWALGINNLYVARVNNAAYRPPRTLVQQNVVVNNITNNTTIVNNTTVVNNVKNVTAVAPIANVNRAQVASLTKVTPAQQQAAAQWARETREAAIRRAKLEAASAATSDGPGKPTPPAQPRSVKLELPKPPPVAAPAKLPTPPPPPIKPERPVIARPTPPVQSPTDKPPATTPPTGSAPAIKPVPPTPKPPPPSPKPEPPPNDKPPVMSKGPSSAPPVTRPATPPAAPKKDPPSKQPSKKDDKPDKPSGRR